MIIPESPAQARTGGRGVSFLPDLVSAQYRSKEISTGFAVSYICTLSKWRVLSSELVLCLSWSLPFYHQLDCSENTVLHPRKRANTLQRKLSACILGYQEATTYIKLLVFLSNLIQLHIICLLKENPFFTGTGQLHLYALSYKHRRAFSARNNGFTKHWSFKP